MNQIKELQENIEYWESVKHDTEVAINHQKSKLEQAEKEIQRNSARLEELSPLPVNGQLWRHNKSGDKYLVVCLGVKNSTPVKKNLRLVELSSGNRWADIEDYEDPFISSGGEGREAFTYLGMAYANLHVDGAPI